MLIDANLLVYAVHVRAPQHDRAREWLSGVLSGSVRVGLPWPSMIAFMRLCTNPRVVERPMTPEDAWAFIEEWLSRSITWIPLPTDGHAAVLGRLVRSHHPTGNLVHDVDLAALAIQHGLTIMSADTDFVRFPEVRWEDPLAPPARRR